MKFISSQMAYFVAKQSTRRNVWFVIKLIAWLFALVTLYSWLFLHIMEYEGRSYSPITGIYWSLTVMSTLGFGDITFESDLGKAFTMVVLFSGVLFFMLVMPFTFIRFIYSPWLDAQANTIIPKYLPEKTSGHVIIVGMDNFALAIARTLQSYCTPYVLLVPDNQQALSLYDAGYKVMVGEVDVPATYNAARVCQASLVLAMYDDMKNTNIAATVREVCPSAPLAARICHKDSYDILELAGANHVYYFAQMLGSLLARRVFNAKNNANIIARFEGFCIAEAPAHNTSLVGKKLRDSDLRDQFGLNVVGVWQGNDYMQALPETIIDEGAVLLLAGTEESIKEYNHHPLPSSPKVQPAVLILGGGTVASAIAEKLTMRGIPFRIVEKNSSRVHHDDPRYVHGNAADISTLKKAGILETDTVIVTTHDDDMNIYLTIYCRKLRPEIQIISRAELDRNIGSLYSAGANLVMSQASIMSTTVINLLTPGRLYMLTEGLHIFRVKAPKSLSGTSLMASGFRKETDCNVIAIKKGENLIIPPDPTLPIAQNDELVLIGTADAEKIFRAKHGLGTGVTPKCPHPPSSPTGKNNFMV